MLEDHETAPLPHKPEKFFGPAVEGNIKQTTVDETHYNWAHAHMKYLPNEAREEAERVIKSAQTEAEKHKTAAWQAYLAQGAAEAKATQVERELKLQMATASEIHEGQMKEQDERVRALERSLESERAAGKLEREQHEKQLDFVREQFDLKLESEKKKHAQLLAMADARATAAEEGAKEAKRRADEDIATIRSKAEHRVMEVRKTCEERISNLEDSHLATINELRAQVAAERKSMEEEIRMYREHAREALDEARLRAEENEKNLRIWRSTQEVQFAKKEGDWRDWYMMQRQHQEDFERHHRKLLELEKLAHGRTVSRTAERLVKSLKYGEAVANGLEDGPLLEQLKDVTDVHEAAGLGPGESANQPALSAPVPSEPLALTAPADSSVEKDTNGPPDPLALEGPTEAVTAMDQDQEPATGVDGASEARATEEEATEEASASGGGGADSGATAPEALDCVGTSADKKAEAAEAKPIEEASAIAAPEQASAPAATEEPEASTSAAAPAAATSTTTPAPARTEALPDDPSQSQPPVPLIPKKPSTGKPPSLEEEAAFFRKHYRQPTEPRASGDAAPSDAAP